MAIDTNTERLIRLADVPRLKWLPRRRGGKRLNISTVFRWVQSGLNGAKLEVVRVGGAMATSEAALLRFFDQLSTEDEPVRTRTPHQRERQITRAEAELATAGI